MEIDNATFIRDKLPIPDMATWKCPCGQLNVYSFDGSMKCCKCRRVWNLGETDQDSSVHVSASGTL